MLCVSNQHLLASTAGRKQAHTNLHKPHVGFRRKSHPVGGKTHFAAAAQGHARGRCHDRFVQVLELHQAVLENLDPPLQVIPFLFLGGKENKGQVGAYGKVLAVVGNDQAQEILAHDIRGFGDHADDVITQGIHLGMEFETGDAVADVHEGCALVSGDEFLSFLERGQEDRLRA